MLRSSADKAGADGDAALLEGQSWMEFIFLQRYSADDVQLIAPVGTNGKNVVVDGRDKEGKELMLKKHQLNTYKQRINNS